MALHAEGLLEVDAGRRRTAARSPRLAMYTPRLRGSPLLCASPIAPPLCFRQFMWAYASVFAATPALSPSAFAVTHSAEHGVARLNRRGATTAVARGRAPSIARATASISQLCGCGRAPPRALRGPLIGLAMLEHERKYQRLVDERAYREKIRKAKKVRAHTHRHRHTRARARARPAL